MTSAWSRVDGHDLRVALVGAHHPRLGLLRRLAELDVAGDQPAQAQLLVHLDVPGLVEQRADLVPQQQVVALGDDERDLRRDRDRAGDRLLDLAAELGRVDGLASPRGVAAGATRSRRRRTCAARPCGRGCPGGRARAGRDGSRPSARARRRRPAARRPAPRASTCRRPAAPPRRGSRAAPRRASSRARAISVSMSSTITGAPSLACAATCAGIPHRRSSPSPCSPRQRPPRATRRSTRRRCPTRPRARRSAGRRSRFGATFRVYLVKGKSRISCKKARSIVRKPPLGRIKNWQYFDWTKGGNAPWSDVYYRHDRKVSIGAIMQEG